MEVTLIGMGGGGGGLLPEAVRALERAELIVGAERLLEALPVHAGKAVAAARTEAIAELLSGADCGRCAVVFSGDTGFYSGAAALLAKLSEMGIAADVIPGISSVQTFAARLKRPWQDWTLCSVHGAECDVIYEVMKGKPVFLLTGGSADARLLCGRLTDAGLGECAVTVGERLSYPDERIVNGTAQEMAGRDFRPLNVVLIEAGPGLLPRRRAAGIPDEEFIRAGGMSRRGAGALAGESIHSCGSGIENGAADISFARNVPMTKQEVRAAILSKLAVRPEDVCWDIGAGTGSVSVELALASREAWAVERDEGACELIRRNREKFRVWNLHLAEGEAPGALGCLPRPDVAFVGGSAGKLTAILDAVEAENPSVRLCVSAIALETLQEAAAWMEAHGFGPEIAQISVSRVRAVGKLHLLTANNPVFLISGARR